MTEHTTQEATGGDELAELFVDVHEGDRLTLTYETPLSGRRATPTASRTRWCATGHTDETYRRSGDEIKEILERRRQKRAKEESGGE